MFLITELTHEITAQIEESEQGKHAYIQGIFAQADIKNRNGRIYPKGILEKATETYKKEYVNTRRALGELNHPPSPAVDPEKACILIESLSWEGNNVIGKAKVLSTPKGQILQALINDNVQLGVSTRGLGSVKKTIFKNESVNVVGEDYSIKAIDVVANPSGIDCFVDGIYESADFYYENGILKSRDLDIIKEHIVHNDKVAIMKDFKKFVASVLK